MPYLNGKKVTNEEWLAATQAPAQGWKDAFGYDDGTDPVDEPVAEEPPKPKRRGRGKKAEVEAVVADVTGLDITLDDDDDDTDTENEPS
jgi:hypothetical protein